MISSFFNEFSKTSAKIKISDFEYKIFSSFYFIYFTFLVSLKVLLFSFTFFYYFAQDWIPLQF